jgi:hypothetical protein
LGKGRQSFAFVSEDGKWVIKFFNQSYFRLPFYLAWMPSERAKRERRCRFYRESYPLAAAELKEETGIVYLHLGPSNVALPRLILRDQKGRRHDLDLNAYPFVLQRKMEPFYQTLEQLPLEAGIEQFVSLVAKRIGKRICDADHEVEANFGVYQGKVIQLDPGRLYFEEHLLEPARFQQEWWSATHRFRKWLEVKHPESIPCFERALEAAKTRSQKGV